MIFQDHPTDTIERRAHRRDLRENIRAGGIIFNHPFDRSYVPFDTRQAVEHLLMVFVPVFVLNSNLLDCRLIEKVFFCVFNICVQRTLPLQPGGLIPLIYHTLAVVDQPGGVG